jgi:tetratricopeptide (TPR) repeat protein/transcriptional regulator with XRE-family HTH domain
VFGDSVRAYRQRSGLTQEELAARAGVSVRSIRDIEAGRTTRARPGTVRLLADALGLAGTERDEFLAGAAAPAVAEPGPTAPRQLPAGVAGFVGRDRELRRLDALATGDRPVGAVVIIAIDGMAGVGKTALAVHWAHRVAHRYPDGQLYLNLRGFDPGGAVPAHETIRTFLDALGVAPQRIPVGLDAQAALYRSLLADRRVLVVLDNASDADQIRPLLPGTPGCLVVVTSRNQLTGLVAAEGAHPLAVDPLSPAESRDLMARRLGAQRVAAESAAVDELIERCARLPLALAIATARAAARPKLALAGLAAELRAHGTLEAFAGEDPATDVRAVFSGSYRMLNPVAARLFRLLGLHPGPDTNVPAVASLAGLGLPQVRPALAELTRAHLLIEHTAGRYTFHDLVRAYAAELVTVVDSDDERAAALHRLLDHYLRTAHCAAVLTYRHRDPISLIPARPGVTPERLADFARGAAWLAAELPVLLAAIRTAAQAGFDAHTCQLAWSLGDFLDRRGHWQELAVTQDLAVAAANRSGDLAAQAAAHRGLARAYSRMGRYADAYEEYQQVLDGYRKVGDEPAAAHAELDLAAAEEHMGHPDRALWHAEEALRLYRATDHPVGCARALNAVGWYQTQVGDPAGAAQSCREAIAILQPLDDPHGLAASWDSLGCAHLQLGEHEEAVDGFQRALDMARALGDRYSQAIVLGHVGDARHATGEEAGARDAWKQALEIFEELRHPGADPIRAKLDSP